MKIVGIHLEPGAVGWHRLWCWTEALKRSGHDVSHRPHAGEQFGWNEIDDYLRGADIVIAGRMHNAKTFAALLAGRDLYRYKLVVDTDDNSDEIPKYNQSFVDYHGGAGTSRIVRAELREADLVTVSTPRLQAWAKKYAKRVTMIPNVIDPRLYANVRARKKELRHENDIRIYWGGGAGHYDDLLPLKEPLLQIFHERPAVKLVFSNFIPDWAIDLPPFRCFMVRFAHFNAYPKVLRWICADLALAPLVDNEFNRCKSNVKYLTYAMSDIPGIYQDAEAYQSVVHGVTGMKASAPDEWYRHINTLLDNRSLAGEITRRARRDVLSHWNVDGHVARYENMLKELINAPKLPEVAMLQEGVPVEARQWAQS